MKKETLIEPPLLDHEILTLTMRAYEAGFCVRDITTFDPFVCSVEDSAAKILRDRACLQFDWIPVQARGRIVGVLERETAKRRGIVRDVMTHLDDGMLIAAEHPLRPFLTELTSTPYRLVVEGTRIGGIVTSSDVQKLPVRLLVFALVTHLEMTMSRLIAHTWTDDDWMSLLTLKRQMGIRKKFEELRTENFDPPLIELTDFCDKRVVLYKRNLLASPSKKTAAQTFKHIEGLRNSVAHAATFVQSEPDLEKVVGLLAMTEEWSRRLGALADHRMD